MLKHLAPCVVAIVSLSAIPAAAHEGVSAEIVALDAKIQKHPKNASLYIERAALYRREGKFVVALDDLATAQKLDPTRREIALERGLTLAAKGDSKEAEASLGVFLASGPPSVKALEARGKIREKAKRFAEARSDYAAAVALKPDPELFLARGRMDEALGHWDAAARGYEEGLRVLSGAIVLRLALVRAEGKRGHYDRAITLIDEVLPTLPVKTEWLLLRAQQHAAAGHAEHARKDREEALREVDARLSRRPTDLARISRAKALLALGRKQEAITELQGVVARSPKLEEARTLLDEINHVTNRK